VMACKQPIEQRCPCPSNVQEASWRGGKTRYDCIRSAQRFDQAPVTSRDASRGGVWFTIWASRVGRPLEGAPEMETHRLRRREGNTTLRLGFFSTSRALTKDLLSMTFSHNAAIFRPYSMAKCAFFLKIRLIVRPNGRLRMQKVSSRAFFEGQGCAGEISAPANRPI